MRDDVVACPCYEVCRGLGTGLGQWCTFRRSEAPNPGMARFRPEETWCAPGVRATVAMLGYMLANGVGGSAFADKLGEVRTWVQSLRRGQSSSYQPTGNSPDEASPRT